MEHHRQIYSQQVNKRPENIKSTKYAYSGPKQTPMVTTSAQGSIYQSEAFSIKSNNSNQRDRRPGQQYTQIRLNEK